MIIRSCGFILGISINCSPLSNLVGLFQRTIIVARHGDRIDIGENTERNGKIT